MHSDQAAAAQQLRHVGRPHEHQQRAAGVKAQLAKCKHEDMPRAPCSNALCSQSAPSTQHHCTEQQTAVCLPAEAPTGEQQQPPPREKITPFRQFKWRTSRLPGLNTYSKGHFWPYFWPLIWLQRHGHWTTCFASPPIPNSPRRQAWKSAFLH